MRSFSTGSRGLIEKLLVVDNGSTDDSPSYLGNASKQLGLKDWVQIVDAKENAGFGAGNNSGFEQIGNQDPQPDILWLLNPDTLVDQTDIKSALDCFLQDPSVGIVGTGIVGCSIIHELAGHRDPSPLSEFVQNAGAFGVLRRWSVSDPALDRPGPVDWVSGASLLIRTEVFEQLGGFDEGFFLYFEEVDLCRRARNAGWKVIYEPRSRIVHLEGSSTGISRTKPMPRYWYESRRRYFVKHYGVLGLWAADLAWTIGRGIGMLRGRGPSSCRGRDLWRGDLPFLLGQKRLNRNHVRG